MDNSKDWYGPESATFGDRLAAAREAADMTQETLAKRLGVKIKTLQAWEDDISEPRANRLSMLAGLLNVSMVWLITGEGEGLSDPDDEETLAPDVNAVLTEIRALRGQFRAKAEKLGRLEKRLRKLLTETE
ncbi:helix-turn-helix domain-containing protein [Mameliella sediminis]|uniref:helix-turn-helix domain-containing protein n=1 Tax=Mameliella sediminis TaxID=2836866 RepID=UPI001C482092|nr:helix-turn-helix transcriptional regulator [Mameliella sediminis]MBY6113337.1 helix-turn-helix domain-containing protein [Antarctobacter heliothermus]MBY6143315.1 helix-turn-helix domain-containing protein [Mameliella alba]MBV7394622.1 helix-turn-helix domain-containing protein [Mameliella sediminis]MBY6164012.1 helix-turn-helix domain-containing protein [Mameliella alba]MBY6172484.1 helix-turn-helix domain-containing protein [Mameliella alba]